MRNGTGQKILYAVRHDEAIRQAAYTWEEHCDWMTGILCGNKTGKIYHSACAAGHKALWHSERNGRRAASVLEQLDPYLVQVRVSGMEMHRSRLL